MSGKKQVRALAVDEEDAKLYWVESEGSAYTFMKSNLDGSDAERVCGGEKNTPFDLRQMQGKVLRTFVAGKEVYNRETDDG